MTLLGVLVCFIAYLSGCDTPRSVEPEETPFIKLFGGDGSEEGKDLVVLPEEEGIVLVGSSTSYTEDGNKNVYVVRTDNIGNVEWERTFGGDGDDVGSSVMIAKDGSVYVCGERTQDSLGLRDVYVLNIDISSGALLDDRVYGDPIRDEYGTDIIELENGGFFITSTWDNSDSSQFYLVETTPNLDTIPL